MPARPKKGLLDFGRRDLTWLLAKVPLITMCKLAYMIVASKYKGHGMALIDSKRGRSITD